MKKLFEKILNERKDLGIIPEYEDFEWYFERECLEPEDEYELREEIETFLDNYTVINIKIKMLSEVKGRRCTRKDVERFESEGRCIKIGETVESYLDGFDDDYFESPEERESYAEEMLKVTEYGIVDYMYL